jgi:uncharacterized protein
MTAQADSAASVSSKGSLMMLRCLDCDSWHRDGALSCRVCLSARLESAKASGNGRLYSLSIVNRPPSPRYEAEAPYVICLVDLSEGPRVLGRLVTDAPADIPAGAAVVLKPSAASAAGGWLLFVPQDEVGDKKGSG